MSLINRSSRGVYAIVPTPFHPDGRLDLDSLRRLVDFYASVGVDGLTVLGQMGEAPEPCDDGSVEIVWTVRVRTDLPVVVGVSSPGFGTMRVLTDHVMTRGAAGVMIAPPTTLRTDDQVVGYYAQAAAALGPE